MDSQKILEGAKHYQEFFRNAGVKPREYPEDLFCSHKDDAPLAHLYYMANMIPEFIYNGKKEKAMRWLCFIQGVLWSKRLQTIKQLKDGNRPD